MDEILSSLPLSEALRLESIAKAMFLSASLEELLKIFLISAAEILDVNRAAIYRFTNQWEGKILVEAISPNCQSIKNQIYPITYFGISSVTKYPCDRAIVLSDIADVSGNLTAYQDWQRSQVKAMMSAPILFDSSTSFPNIWGLAVVQQCEQSRQWQTSEAELFFKASQILGKCLQSWELRLQSSMSSQFWFASNHTSGEIVANDLEEFIAERVDLFQDLEVISAQQQDVTLDNLDKMTVSSNFVLADDDENEILDRVRERDNGSSVNLAMQRLDWEINHNFSQYSSTSARIKYSHDSNDVDVESTTLKDILEECTHDKVEYLQKKVDQLTASLKQKSDEIAILHRYIQEFLHT